MNKEGISKALMLLHHLPTFQIFTKFLDLHKKENSENICHNGHVSTVPYMELSMLSSLEFSELRTVLTLAILGRA